MNTNKLKAYAPKARLAFMDAVRKRAAVLGIYEDRISEASTQGTDTLIEGRIFTRQQGQQRQQLVKRIEALGGGKEGYNQFINEMAFTWFNRFTAIRYMEINEYLDHGFRVLSKGENAQFGEGFEILAHAADVAEDLDLNKSEIVQMVLAGDKEEELFRELLLGQCHQLSRIMPFMFEKLDDATELLLPDNLTKTDSILKDLVNDLPEDNWRDFDEDKGQIEVIGWLYQFYISEHKDAVIGKVVKKEDIPAATQLFTPNWIVKYLVQNSLGRQWLATYPNSALKDKMEYYITPVEQSSDVIEQLKAITPNSINPEKIKVLDPACGSGHILVEVYEVLREIYLESGYSIKEIPKLILTNNIYGLDIDDRAAQMAAFAVLMKAREDDRRIFSRIEDNDIKLNIHAIQSTEHLDINKLWSDLDLDCNKQAGSIDDLFAEPQLDISEVSAENMVYLNLLRYLKEQFMDAKNLGSLIEIDNNQLDTLSKLKNKLLNRIQSIQPTSKLAANTLLTVVEQAIALATKYHVIVANPPYMGSKGMNLDLKEFGKQNFKNSKSDLYSMVCEKAFSMLHEYGFNAMIVMEGWMFLSSYEKYRNYILKNNTIINLIHMPYNGKGRTSLGINFGTTASIIQKGCLSNFKANFSCLRHHEIDAHGVPLQFPINNDLVGVKGAKCFDKLPSKTISYWAQESLIALFEHKKMNFFSGGRCKTTNDELYLRKWWEISKIDLGYPKKWTLLSKGGEARKYYGNVDTVIKWDNAAKNFYKSVGGLTKEQFWEKDGITWTIVSSKDSFSFRLKPQGVQYNSVSPTIFSDDSDLYGMLGVLNSASYSALLKLIAPTLAVNVGEVLQLPSNFPASLMQEVSGLTRRLVDCSKSDWDSHETSDSFSKIFGLELKGRIDNTYKNHIEIANDKIKTYQETQRRIDELIGNHLGLDFISDRNDIILRCDFNGSNSSKTYFTINLLSYFLGCISGRYSLDREGLVYAHSGNQGFKELVAEGAYKTFPADDDGIIPLAAEEWLFEDDATSRFREFVKTVWGEEHLQENLDFIAESLCLDAIKPKKNERTMDTIRRYFSSQFYKDHLKTYKKRPIYWLFSSGKEKAFECLVYLHRYNESTLARMRTEYVTPLMGRMESQYSVLEESRANASGAEQRRIDKELKSIEKKQSELRAFDEELKHLAEMKISIDLDDGVKVNYGKFGNLLADVKAIHGKKPEAIR